MTAALQSIQESEDLQPFSRFSLQSAAGRE